MIKIGFHTPQIDVRGTCSALYDYAHYNELLLKNKSIIVVPQKSIINNSNDLIAIEKFEDRFRIVFYEDKEDLQKILEDEKCDIIYSIKYGTNDNFIFDNIKNCIHCVFDMSQPHGDVYAGVSHTIATKYGKSAFVPHMIGLKPSETGENLREELGIPKEALVFGRHGGEDTFNIDFVKDSIKKIVRQRDDIYFIFVNTPAFDDHSHIFFLKKIIKDEDKNRFIMTCDAHLECGTLGHTFGLSMGEFAVNNKPIIAYGGWTWNTAHKDILGYNAIYFNDQNDFYDLITTFDPIKYSNIDFNCYKDYTPEKVMIKFKEVFIDN